MNESVSAAPGAGQDVDNALAAGQALKRAREAAGLHVVALAAALKVPVKKLEALEAGRMHELPDATFARALASSVCRQLKIDPAGILAALPQGRPMPLGDVGALNTPFRTPRDSAGPSNPGQALKRPLIAALAILVGAALVWWWVPQPGSPTAAEATASMGATAESGTSLGAGASVGDEGTVPVDAPAHEAPTVPPAASPAQAPQAAEAPAPAVAEAAPATPATPVAQADGWLQIQGRGESWIEVRAAGGRLVVQRLLQAGDTLAVADAGPLSVVIGRADATEVRVRGQAMDLAAVARNNVARFEAK